MYSPTFRCGTRKTNAAAPPRYHGEVSRGLKIRASKKFWNLFHLQPMRDQKGEVQYFIGVQLDGSVHVEPINNCIPEATAKESAKLVKQTAENVDEAVRELPDANMKPDDLWINHSKVVHPKPHRKDSPPWKAIQKVLLMERR